MLDSGYLILDTVRRNDPKSDGDPGYWILDLCSERGTYPTSSSKL